MDTRTSSGTTALCFNCALKQRGLYNGKGGENEEDKLFFTNAYPAADNDRCCVGDSAD